jgi:plastocyanin
MKRKYGIGFIAVITAILFVALSKEAVHVGATTKESAAQSNSAPAAVKIDNFSFGPAELTVSVGTTVQWTNRDDIPHTVVSTDGVFKSHALDTDESFSYKFDKTGTYPYFCSLHPKMTGKVVVQ